MKAQDHIIHRQIVETCFSTRSEAMEHREEISQIYHHELLPLINEIFDEAVNANEHVRIEHLEIDLGRISSGNIKNEMAERFKKKLVDELRKILQERTAMFSDSCNDPVHAGMVSAKTRKELNRPEKHAAAVSSRQSDLELFIYFVEQGRLPWWGRKGKVKHFEDLATSLIDRHPQALAPVIGELMRYSNYLHRLIHQLPDRILVSLIDLLRPGARESLMELHEDFYSIHLHRQLLPLNDTGFRLVCWQCAFQFYAGARLPGVSHEGDTSVGKTLSYSTQEYIAFLISELSHYSRPDVTLSTSVKMKFFTDQIIANMRGLSGKKYFFRSRSLKKMISVISKEFKEAVIEEQPTHIASGVDADDLHSGKKVEKKNVNVADPGDEDGIEIHNAGLVLLWPFLPALFEGIGLAESKLFVTEDAAKRGALLLQYAVTKETEMPEYEMTLNKLMCGVDIDEPLPSTVVLTAIEQEEIGHLLETVALRWEALKGSSGEALRRTFLTRDAILSKNINGWKLTIERAAMDMLLDKLPWSISIVKLPWCKQSLYVEW